MVCAELHVAGNDLVVEALLGFDVEKPGHVRSLERNTRDSIYLLSPFETKPMVSKGSCLTGRRRSHGAEDFRLRGGGGCAMAEPGGEDGIKSWIATSQRRSRLSPNGGHGCV